MFLTTNQHQLPTLLGSDARAWASVALQFDVPVFLCSWTRNIAGGQVKGTELVLLEHDLRRWVVGAAAFGLRTIQMLVPTVSGWTFRDIESVFEHYREDMHLNALVFADSHGELLTLWPGKAVRNVVATPLWRKR